MKKILWALVFIFLCSTLSAFADGIDVYYIRARDYNKPSLETRTEAGKILIKSINEAKKTIDFAFYGLAGQDEILNALLEAQNRGVKIRGVVDMDVKGLNDYRGTLDNIKKFKKGTVKTDYNCDIQKLRKIRNNEILYPIKFNGHLMHNKFCVIDKKIIWTGTANISSTGTGGYNENAVLLICSEKLADLYTQEMDEMYENEHFHEMKKEIYINEPILIDDVQTRVYFSPCSQLIDKAILPEIKSSKKYIYLSLFLISHYEIAKELVKAKKRGVKVKLITEANHAQQKYSAHNYLRKNGIKVKVENWGGKLHTKLAVIDDDTIIIGSTNWTKTATLYNDENMLILKNAPIQAKFLRKEFELSYKSIPLKWLFKNPNPEGKDSPVSCFDGIDNDHNGLVDSEDPACFNVKYRSKYFKSN